MTRLRKLGMGIEARRVINGGFRRRHLVSYTNGVAIALSVDTSASNLSPGTYGPAIAFTNLSNGRGSATFPATLTVRAPLSSSRPAGEIARARGGYLLNSHGGYLLDDRNSRLLAQ